MLAQATAEVVAWLRENVHVGGAHVLDLGCGIGRIANALTEVASVTGTDVSFVMLREARRRLATRAALVQTGTALPFRDAVFDLILAVDSFPYVVLAAEAENTMAEIARVAGAAWDDCDSEPVLSRTGGGPSRPGALGTAICADD